MTQRMAVVTGGMGGLGEAICIKLARMGYKVVTTCSPGNTKREAWLTDMKKQGFDFKAYEIDVADFDSCQNGVAKIQSECGPIDVLVNNAGITRDTTFRKMDKASWDAVMNTNLDSVFNMTKPIIDWQFDRRPAVRTGTRQFFANNLGRWIWELKDGFVFYSIMSGKIGAPCLSEFVA